MTTCTNGHSMVSGDVFCGSCGSRSLTTQSLATNSSSPISSATPGTLPPRTGFAVAALVCGIIGLIPLAVIFGLVALHRIRTRNESGRGFALAGVWLGVAWIAVIGITVAASNHTNSGYSISYNDGWNSARDSYINNQNFYCYNIYYSTRWIPSRDSSYENQNGCNAYKKIPGVSHYLYPTNDPNAN